MEKKEDRRILRTRSMLLDALLDLMIEKGYEATTVQDIIDRANVGRSTFYAHFQDKEQLLTANIGQLRDFLMEQSLVRPVSVPGESFRWAFSLPMLEHILSHKRIYRATVSRSNGSAIVLQHMQAMMSGLIRDQIDGIEPKPGNIPPEVLVPFIVNTFLTLVAWWMDQPKPCPAEEVDRIFHQLTLSGILAE